MLLFCFYLCFICFIGLWHIMQNKQIFLSLMPRKVWTTTYFFFFFFPRATHWFDYSSYLLTPFNSIYWDVIICPERKKNCGSYVLYKVIWFNLWFFFLLGMCFYKWKLKRIYSNLWMRILFSFFSLILCMCYN